MEAKLIHETQQKIQVWAGFCNAKGQTEKDFYNMVVQQVKDHLKISKIPKFNSYIVFDFGDNIINKININTL